VDNIQFNAYTPKLPTFNYQQTQGILYTNEGDIVPLQSGAVYPQYSNYVSATHVEGQAAIYIRQNGSSGGPYCDNMLETLLPEGATLTVIPPANAVPKNPKWNPSPTLYTGNANTPSPNKRTQP
jgi:hypothetical protein